MFFLYPIPISTFFNTNIQKRARSHTKHKYTISKRPSPPTQTNPNMPQVLASKLKQRRQLPSGGSSLARHPSLPEEHASGVDPRSTSSDPILGAVSYDIIFYVCE